MSLETKYKTEIRVPPVVLASAAANIEGTVYFDILKRAFENVARDRGGAIDTAYLLNNGERRKCLLALHTPDLQAGVGVKIEDDGRLSFLWDAAADRRGTAEAIRDEVTHNYVTIAVLRVQAKRRFRAEVEDRTAARGKKRARVKGVA